MEIWSCKKKDSARKTKHEVIKIGKYYAEESMLLYDADADAYDASKTPQFGENLLYDYYCSLRDDPDKIPDMGSQKLFSWKKIFQIQRILKALFQFWDLFELLLFKLNSLPFWTSSAISQIVY